MKKILILAFLLLSLGTYAQREVPQSRMEQIYERKPRLLINMGWL